MCSDKFLHMFLKIKIKVLEKKKSEPIPKSD